MGESVISEQLNGMGQNKKPYEQDKIGFENLIETPFMNSKWELMISFLTVINNIFHSLSLITVPTL
jgi:hypothetical protein